MARLSPPDDGAFASARFLIEEHRWRRVGQAALALLVVGACLGMVSNGWVAVRAAAIYLFLLVAFRLAGHRTLAQITNFDLVLVLIISETTQNVLIGTDDRLTTAAVSISTLILLDLGLGTVQQRIPGAQAITDGLPAVLVAHGRVDHERMTQQGVQLDDVLAAARERQGITRLADIEFAVLEKSGGISVVPSRRAP